MDMTEKELDDRKYRKNLKKVSLSIVSIGVCDIPCSNILYFEAFGHTVLLHTSKNEELKCNENLTTLENRLCQDGFIRPHRSYLVNMAQIERLDNENIILFNQEKICMSRRRVKEVRKAFFEWNFIKRTI